MRPALRLLPLSLCIAVSLQVRAADDMPPNWAMCPMQDVVPPFADATKVPEGLDLDDSTQPTDIEGDALSGTQDNPVFNGGVTLRRGSQFMAADQLMYDKAQERYTAEGSIRFQGSGLRMTAARAEGDQAKDLHSIYDLEYQLLSQRGNGGADSIILNKNTGSLRGATYSTCSPQQRHWELRAERIDINTETGVAVTRNATLHVGKIPVLYLPWFMFPTSEQRSSGLLPPSISNSSRNGFDWRQPIYLNLAPNYDATINPRVMSARGLQLGAQFRYLNANGAGTLEGAWMSNDDLRDRERGTFTFTGHQDIGTRWQARANVNWISDPRYYEDFSGSLEGLSRSTSHSEIGVYGRGQDWDAGVSFDHWQLADFTLTEAVLPFNRLPRGFVHWQHPLGANFVGGIDAEAVRFEHPVLDAGSRLDLKPWIGLPLQGDSWFLRTTAAYRHTAYTLEDSLNGGHSPSRGQPIFSVDAGVFFDRDTKVKGKTYLQTIEPRLYYLRVPYADQNDMPLFDTQPLTFSWEQLFRDNRYSGADRQADANQLTLAVSTRMIRQADGFQRFSASLGQIRYFDASRVLIPGEPITLENRSAWVADFDYAPTDRWTFGASYQWDPKFSRTDLASVRARYLLPDNGLFNLGYRYRRGVLEQTDLSFLYPINASWSVVGRHYYSLRDRKPLESLAGVQWESCCVAVRLVGRRYVHNRVGELNNTLMFEIELKGLGSAGQDSRDTLRRAILGYNRDDLYLVPPQTATGQPVPPEIGASP